MGNSGSDLKQAAYQKVNYEENYEFLRTINDEHYGAIKLLRNKVTNETIALLTRNFSGEDESELFLKYLSRRLYGNPFESIVKLINYNSTKQEHLCSTSQKIQAGFEYITGTLEEEIHMRRTSPMAETELWYICEALLNALELFQKQGYSHGDIRPRNILLSDERKVKLLDNSMWKSEKPCPYIALLFGNKQDIYYISPKMISDLKRKERSPNHDVHKSDIFALGMTIMECASLKKVHSCYDYLGWEIKKPPMELLLKDLEGRYSQRFNDILRRMLIFEEFLRPGSGELLRILQQSRSAGEIGAATYCLQPISALKEPAPGKTLSTNFMITNPEQVNTSAVVAPNQLNSSNFNTNNFNYSNTNLNNTSAEQISQIQFGEPFRVEDLNKRTDNTLLFPNDSRFSMDNMDREKSPGPANQRLDSNGNSFDNGDPFSRVQSFGMKPKDGRPAFVPEVLQASFKGNNGKKEEFVYEEIGKYKPYDVRNTPDINAINVNSPGPDYYREGIFGAASTYREDGSFIEQPVRTQNFGSVNNNYLLSSSQDRFDYKYGNFSDPKENIAPKPVSTYESKFEASAATLGNFSSGLDYGAKTPLKGGSSILKKSRNPSPLGGSDKKKVTISEQGKEEQRDPDYYVKLVDKMLLEDSQRNSTQV